MANGQLPSKKTNTLGRERPKLVRCRQNTESPGGSPITSQMKDNTGPLTIVAVNVTGEDVDRAIEDARRAITELHIRDSNSKVFHNNFENPIRGDEEEEEQGKNDETSTLELLCNLNSST